MTTMFAFRLLLILSIVCDLAAWTWRDLEYTRVIADEMGRAKGDQTLLITAALFVLFATPLWRAWRLSGALMVALTALAIVGRLVRPADPYTTNDGIMLLEIIAATSWGAMLAMAYSAEGRRLFVRGLFS